MKLVVSNPDTGESTVLCKVAVDSEPGHLEGMGLSVTQNAYAFITTKQIAKLKKLRGSSKFLVVHYWGEKFMGWLFTPLCGPAYLYWGRTSYKPQIERELQTASDQPSVAYDARLFSPAYNPIGSRMKSRHFRRYNRIFEITRRNYSSFFKKSLP